MSDIEPSGLAIIEQAGAHLAAPVRTPLLKALSDLLGGLTAIPAAKLKQYAQSIEDTTAARSAVVGMMAQAAGQGGLIDPVLMQAAAEVYLPTALRKAKNRLLVAQRTAEHVREATADTADPAAPDDDWMNTFMRFAEDASSEQLQDLFGRILAGQVVRPGSFALATLRAVAELDQSVAEYFSLIWAKSVGEAVDYGPEFRLGEGYSRWKRLVEAGLMASSETAQFLPPYDPVIDGNGLWSPMVVGGTFLTILFPQHCAARWEHIGFTRVGQQIGSILPPPDYVGNMRRAGQKLAQRGVTRVDLHTAGQPVELIYAAPPLDKL